MKARIVRIGNSQGVRIPKLLLEQSGLGPDVDLELENGTIVIRAASRPRQGWEDAFGAMARAGDDALLDAEITTTVWDEENWEW